MASLNETLPHPRLAPCRRTLDALETLADLASENGLVHLVVPREPGVVERARAIAERDGIEVSVDLMASTIRIQFGNRPT